MMKHMSAANSFRLSVLALLWLCCLTQTSSDLSSITPQMQLLANDEFIGEAKLETFRSFSLTCSYPKTYEGQFQTVWISHNSPKRLIMVTYNKTLEKKVASIGDNSMFKDIVFQEQEEDLYHSLRFKLPFGTSDMSGQYSCHGYFKGTTALLTASIELIFKEASRPITTIVTMIDQHFMPHEGMDRPLTMMCNSTGAWPPRVVFSWYFRNEKIENSEQVRIVSDAETSLLTFAPSSLSKSNSGVYLCIAHNKLGESVASHDLQLEVAPEAYLRILPEHAVMLGDTVSLQCSDLHKSTQPRPLAISIYAENENQINATTPGCSIVESDGYELRCTFTNVQLFMAGNYRCYVRNVVGESYSEPAIDFTVEYTSTQPMLSSEQFQFLDQSSNAALACTLETIPPPTTLWWSVNVHLEDARAPQVNLSKALPSDKYAISNTVPAPHTYATELTLANLSTQESADYYCNFFVSSQIRSTVKKSAYAIRVFHLQARSFDAKVMEQSPATLRCDTEGFPEIKSVVWYFSEVKDGQYILVNNSVPLFTKATVKIEEIGSRTGNSYFYKSFKLTMKQTFTMLDGYYKCVAHNINQMSAESSPVKLTVTLLPLAPAITIHRKGLTYSLSWIQDSSQEGITHYEIYIRKAEDTNSTVEKVIVPAKTPLYNYDYNLGELDRGIDYITSVKACTLQYCSRQNASLFVISVPLDVPVPVPIAQSSDNPDVLVFVVVIIVAIIVPALLVVLLLFYRKRRTREAVGVKMMPDQQSNGTLRSDRSYLLKDQSHLNHSWISMESSNDSRREVAGALIKDESSNDVKPQEAYRLGMRNHMLTGIQSAPIAEHEEDFISRFGSFDLLGDSEITTDEGSNLSNCDDSGEKDLGGGGSYG